MLAFSPSTIGQLHDSIHSVHATLLEASANGRAHSPYPLFRTSLDVTVSRHDHCNCLPASSRMRIRRCRTTSPSRRTKAPSCQTASPLNHTDAPYDVDVVNGDEEAQRDRERNRDGGGSDNEPGACLPTWFQAALVSFLVCLSCTQT